MPPAERLSDIPQVFEQFINNELLGSLPYEPEEEPLVDGVEEYLSACHFASQFYGQTANENLLWVRALEMPENEHLRVKVGFDVDAQVAGSLKIYSEMMQESKNLDDIYESLIRAAVENYYGYNFEFVTREPVMLNPLKRIGGKIVAHRYNNMPLEEIPGESERDGVYIETVRLLVKELVEAAPGDVFVMTSPKGWAYTDGSGQDYEFPESQTYLYRINADNELEAITVRTDMTTDEHERFLERLTAGEFKAEKGLSHKEQLKHISGLLVKRTNMDFSDVISAMKEVTGRDVAWTDNGKKRITFDQMAEKARNVDKLYSTDEDVQNIIDGFSMHMKSFGYIKSEEDIVRLIELMGKTALDISRAHGIKTGRVETPKVSYSCETQVPLPTVDYIAEAMYNSVQKGCMMVASGTAGWQNTVLGERLVKPSAEKKYVKNCGNCGAKIESEIEAGYVCSSCMGTYEGC